MYKQGNVPQKRHRESGDVSRVGVTDSPFDYILGQVPYEADEQGQAPCSEHTILQKVMPWPQIPFLRSSRVLPPGCFENRLFWMPSSALRAERGQCSDYWSLKLEQLQSGVEPFMPLGTDPCIHGESPMSST